MPRRTADIVCNLVYHEPDKTDNVYIICREALNCMRGEDQPVSRKFDLRLCAKRYCIEY